MKDKKRAQREYAAMFGQDKLAEQVALAKGVQVCCGEPKPGHHPACSKYVPDEIPAVIDGQESLL